MKRIEYKILKYVKNTNKKTQIKEVTRDTVKDIFHVNWTDFSSIVYKMVEKNYLTKSAPADNGMDIFNSNITDKGLQEVEKYNSKIFTYSWGVIVALSTVTTAIVNILELISFK